MSGQLTFTTASVFPYSTSLMLSDDDENEMPWESSSWIPTTKSGKQKSPNTIRNQLQKHIDECRTNGTSTQTRIIEELGVNNNSFRKFMNPKTYKDQWSATQNGTYWAAARFLEKIRHEREVEKKDIAKKKNRKRKSDELDNNDKSKNTKENKIQSSLNTDAKMSASLSKAKAKVEALQLINKILAVKDIDIDEDSIFDTCPQVVAKYKEFLARPGMTKVNLLSALDNMNSGSLNRFLAGKKQDQCANVAYKKGYFFFEKMRILEGKPKSKARMKNEVENPDGFSVEKQREARWFIRPNSGTFHDIIF